MRRLASRRAQRVSGGEHRTIIESRGGPRRVRSGPVTEPREAFDALDEPWRVALTEAWRSWSSGCAGVGAVVSDVDGRIVAVGRNRMIEERREPGVLASTALAHAEMNEIGRAS